MTTRRDLLRRAPLFPASLLLATAGQKQQKEEVAPGEDLMREHGVLNRALLVYEAWLDAPAPPAQVLDGTANLIHRFVEDYHEKIEEDEVFHRLLGEKEYQRLGEKLEEREHEILGQD